MADGRNLEEIAQDVDDFSVSADGATVLYSTRKGLFLRSRGEEEARQLDLSEVKLEVDPAAEWRQMYREAWRLMRDYFYDPGHHGQDLAALERHYEVFLPQVKRRRDFTQLLRRMLGHVSVSHMSIGGGDTPPRSRRPERVGTLGADFEIDRGRYRITRIYRSGPAASTNRLVTGAPLDQPGVDVREGDYLLAVDDTPIDASQNLFAYFVGKAYRPLRLTVGPHPDDGGGDVLGQEPEKSFDRNHAQHRRRFRPRGTRGRQVAGQSRHRRHHGRDQQVDRRIRPFDAEEHAFDPTPAWAGSRAP